jgi:hypothetical protein
MTAATFGSLLGPVHARLEEAAGFDHSPGAATVATAAQMAGRVARTLARYLADIAPYGMAEAINSPVLDARVRAVVDAREALRQAEAGLPPGDQEHGAPGLGAADPLVRWLGEAAESLAAGRDLLRSHFGTGTDDRWTERSDWAAAVDSLPVTRALVAAVAGWSRQLSCAMARLSVAAAGDRSVPVSAHQGLANASHWLVTASATLWAAQRGDPASAADGELLAAIPVNVRAAREPPQEGETVAEIAAGVAASAARLRQIAWVTADRSAWSPVMTADSWQWTATAAAVACHVSGLMLQAQIDHHGSEAGAPGLGGELRLAAEATARACGRWRAAAAAWQQVMTETKGLTAPTVPDAGDLVVRLGRLAFGDPAWTPSAGSRTPVRDLTDRSADGVRFLVAVEAMHHAAEALARAGAADLRAVGTAVRASRLYVPTRTLPERYDVPYKFGHATPAQAAAVVDAYQAAREAAAHMVENLDALAVTLHSPSRILAAARAAAHPAQRNGLAGVLVSLAALPSSPMDTEVRAVENISHRPVEQAVRELHITEPLLLLRAKAIDLAGRELLTEARRTYFGHSASRGAGDGQTAGAASAQARLAAQSFPRPRAAPIAPAGTTRHARRHEPAADVHSRRQLSNSSRNQTHR